MPTISIILPIYQVEAFIQGCIRSILAQTYTDFECICVDDGSPDRSSDLAREAIGDDPRFLMIRQENKMLGGARNTGISHAKGDYITFIDSDDYMHPRMLEILLSTLKESEADVSGCLIQKTPDMYEVINESVPPYKVKLYDHAIESYIQSKKLSTSVCARLYKRSLILDIPFFEKMFYEDTPWTPLVFARCKRYAQASASLYYYYANPHSIMRTNWSEKKTEDLLKTLCDIDKNIQSERPDILKELRRKLIRPTLKMVFNRIQRMPRQQRAALWEHASPLIKEMYERNIVGYAGLKLKHKLRLFWLLYIR